VTAAFVWSLTAFTVDFAASDTVAAGLFSATGADFFSFMLVGAAFLVSEVVPAG
jgi:hypothetical protein